MSFDLILALIIGAGVPIGAVAFLTYKTRHVRRDALKALQQLH